MVEDDRCRFHAQLQIKETTLAIHGGLELHRPLVLWIHPKYKKIIKIRENNQSWYSKASCNTARELEHFLSFRFPGNMDS